MAFRTLEEGQWIKNSLVVDNSVMMRWLFNDGSEKDQQYATNVFNHIKDNKVTVLVPYLWVYQASFVVNSYCKRNVLNYEDAKNHLSALFSLVSVIRGEEHTTMLFEFSNQHGLSSYDASYTLLAISQKSTIATLDKQMVKVCKRMELKVF